MYEDGAWSEVPVVVQKAMTTLAHASSSLTSRLGVLEREMESQKLLAVELASRHLNRVKALEAQLKEFPVPVQTRDDNILRCVAVADSEKWCLWERKLQAQLDAGRADAAAARAAASWPGITKDMLQTSVFAALDEVAPRFLARTAAVVVREMLKSPNSVVKDDVACQIQLDGDVIKPRDIMLNALSRLDAEVKSRPTREETSLIAEAAARRHCNSLKSYVVSDRFKLNTSWSPTPATISSGPVQDFVCVEASERSGPAYAVISEVFERRCDVVETRCDEIVHILNRKAYKSDVSGALVSLERTLRQVYREGRHRCGPLC